MEKTPYYKMGSSHWVEQVFRAAPVRANKGRSKHTQFHGKWMGAGFNREVGAQGRNEACALLALEYFHTLGLVRRFKEQPFETNEWEFDTRIYPDFLVELPDRRLLVVEIKTERFLTHAKQLVLDSNRQKFSTFGITYLVWTDQRPLNHAARHHLINMNRFAGEGISASEIDGLVNLVSRQRALALAALYDAGFDLGCLYAAVWTGKVFASIGKPFDAETQFTAWRQENLESTFLDCQRSSIDWWDSLS